MVLLTDFFEKTLEHAWLTSHNVYIKYFLELAISTFWNSSISIERGSGAHLGLGMRMDEVLNAGLGLALDIGMCIWKDTEDVVNMFSSCCLDIFP